MDRAKQVGSSYSYSSSSSSSFTADLFGPKDSSKSSSSALFGSIFSPPTSMVPRRDPSRPQFGRAYGINDKHESIDSKTQKGNCTTKKDKNSNYEKATGEPCYFNSSIYYGGQEVYPSTSTRNIGPPQNYKKDGGDIDQSESNSNCASRGNWWEGSLYY